MFSGIVLQYKGSKHTNTGYLFVKKIIIYFMVVVITFKQVTLNPFGEAS